MALRKTLSWPSFRCCATTPRWAWRARTRRGPAANRGSWRGRWRAPPRELAAASHRPRWRRARSSALSARPAAAPRRCCRLPAFRRRPGTVASAPPPAATADGRMALQADHRMYRGIAVRQARPPLRSLADIRKRARLLFVKRESGGSPCGSVSKLARASKRIVGCAKAELMPPAIAPWFRRHRTGHTIGGRSNDGVQHRASEISPHRRCNWCDGDRHPHLGHPAATGSTWPAWTGLDGKTAWDLANLVIVPVSLAVIAFLFSDRQRLEDREIARAQREQDLRMAERRRSTDNEIALNREREEALQAYLSTTTREILRHDLADARWRPSCKPAPSAFSPGWTATGGRRSWNPGRCQSRRRRKADHPPFHRVSVEHAGRAGLDVGRVAERRQSQQFAACACLDPQQRSALRRPNGGGSQRCRSLQHGPVRSEFVANQPSRAILVGANLSKGIPSRASVSAAKAKADAREAEESWLAKLDEAKISAQNTAYATKWPAGSTRWRAPSTSAVDSGLPEPGAERP